MKPCATCILLFSALLTLPVPALAERVFKVTLDGQTYSARVVTDEPSGHLRGEITAAGAPDLQAGPFESAVRIGGTDDIDTAIRVLAAVCGFTYDAVKDWGAYGDPVWTDPRNGEITFWTPCTGE